MPMIGKLALSTLNIGRIVVAAQFQRLVIARAIKRSVIAAQAGNEP